LNTEEVFEVPNDFIHKGATVQQDDTATLHDINVRRMVKHISDQLTPFIGEQTEDAKPAIQAFFNDLIDRRGIKDFTVGGPGEGIVESYTVNDEKRGNQRGVLVGGNTAGGERITHVFLRNKRTAKKRGRGLIGMLVMPYSFIPSRPLELIQFTVEAKRG